VDIEIKRVVTEYKAEMLRNAEGTLFKAKFPVGITHAVHYSPNVKAQSVYMSQSQLLPYERLTQYFRDQCGIPLSEGSVFNFNKQAYDRLEIIEGLIRDKLRAEPVIHADETGINIKGKLAWLHTVSSPRFVAFFPHSNRGTSAMEAMDVLPKFEGVVVHDHWKAYFQFDFLHALCNAHHLRELKAAEETGGQVWAKKMHGLLSDMNKVVHAAQGRIVDASTAKTWVKKYRKVLREGDIECPAPVEREKGVTRGKIARSKPRNLLERLRDYENETLRFLMDPLVPFTNNQGENDIRMTKVQQKISGCFRTLDNAKIFCRIRGFLLTCQRLKITHTEALSSLFSNQLPPALAAVL
jgi:transposase